jgi:dienelactone hydrolase
LRCHLQVGPRYLGPHEIWSVNFHIQAATDYFGALGYMALAPNLYWRLDDAGGDTCINDYSDKLEGDRQRWKSRSRRFPWSSWATKSG